MMYDDDDIYVDGSDPGGFKVREEDLDIGETVAEGRFAVIKQANVFHGGEKKKVAVKMLRSKTRSRIKSDDRE